MLLHNLKQIFRSLLRHKSFTFINLIGLSIGIATTITIFLIADYEKNFDGFHSNTEQVFRVVKKVSAANEDVYEASVPYPTGKLFRNQYAGLQATQIHFGEDVNIRIGQQSPFEETNVVFADSLFFTVMDFSGVKDFVVTGDAVRALSHPNKAILTQTTARKYFGNDNPIGKIISLDNKADVEIAAVVKDIPATTHLPINVLVSYATFNKDFMGGLDPNSFTFTGNGYCYVRLKDAASVSVAEKALAAVVQQHGEKDKRQKFYLQPLNQVHFDNTFEASNPSYTVTRKYLTMLMLLGGFIILIACVNYINLFTSLAFSKSKEVGIRKTIGASKGQLFIHYLTETIVVTTVAAVIGMALTVLMLPTVNSLLGKSVSPAQLGQGGFIIKILAGILFISFISGIYPSLILAGFNPITALKNRFVMPGKSSAILRKALVVFQFTTSIALIICTIVIAKQMNYFRSKELGFKKEAVVEVALPVSDSAKMESFRTLLNSQSGIENLSFCLGAPISENGFSTSLDAPELPKGQDHSVKVIPCDRNYLPTYELKLLAGRWFLPGEEKKLGSSLVVNEALIKTLGYKNAAEAIGKKIRIGINDFNPVIIGVTKNFHVSSLHNNINPVALMPFPYFYYAASIRVQPASMKNTLAQIESAWKKVYPESVYSMKFIDEALAKSYEQENKDYNLFKAFSVISIFICCIGLWGLIAFVVVRKTKEIGVRKVLGASISNIVGLLSKDFLKLVLLGLLVASPIAWYFMSKWLEGFAYRIDISWWVFFIAGLFAVIIALVTTSFQTIKAALANPVKNLRTE